MKRQIHIKWRVTLLSFNTVEVGEDVEAVVARLRDAGFSADEIDGMEHDPKTVEYAGWEYADEVKPPVWLDVPEHGRWASDGACAIREGSPLPSLMSYGDWHEPDGHQAKTASKTLVGWLTTAVRQQPASDGAFHGRFAPLFAGADAVTTHPTEKRVAVVWRDGIVTAFVMPLREVHPNEAPIRWDGTPVLGQPTTKNGA